MAKFECRLQANFNEVLNTIEDKILNGSMSASFEDESYFVINDVHCAVKVYERYSMMGNNRVSLNITLLGHGDNLHLSAITSGGSQAVFFKINTVGEESFLDCLIKIIKEYNPIAIV